MDFTIRRAKTDDAPAITHLVLLSKKSNGYSDEFIEQCREELGCSESDIQEYEFWIAEDQYLIGVVGCETDTQSKTAKVFSLFVHPDEKRRGVGAKLFLQLKESLIERKISVVELDSDPFAVDFYKALGFEIVGESPSGSIPGRMLPKMSLNLST